MALSDSVFELIMGVNPWIIFGSAILQQLFAFLWFSGIVKTIVDYYLAADKGVRKVEHIVHRYSAISCSIATLAAGVARAIAVDVVVAVFHGTTLCDYQYAAVLVALISCINQHHFLWCQRPIPLLLTDCGYELVAALLTSVCCFGLRNFVF